MTTLHWVPKGQQSKGVAATQAPPPAAVKQAQAHDGSKNIEEIYPLVGVKACTCFTAAGGGNPIAVIKERDNIPLAGGDTPLDTAWLDDVKQAESVYNDFYKEPVKSINLFLLYVNKENEVEHLNSDKYIVQDNGVIHRDIIISLIKRYQYLCSRRYKLLSLLKYNIDLEPTDIHNFIEENKDISDKRFITSEKYLNDIQFDDSIHMFQDLNALFFIFYEENATSINNSHTKRVRLSVIGNSKTKRSNPKRSNSKRNNNDMVKNLKIKKQVS